MPVDANAIVSVLTQHRATIFAYIWSIVHDTHIAEDVFQEVSLLALDKRDEIENAQALLPWLRTTSRFRSLHALEKRGKQPLVFDSGILDSLDHAWHGLDTRSPADSLDALRHCLDQLTPNSRDLLKLAYSQNLSPTQIAARMGRQVNAIYQALGRTHRALSDCVRKRLNHV